MGKKVAYSIFILLFFTLLTIILTYPACFHLSDKLIGDGGDNYQFLSFQYIINKNILKGLFPFSWSNILRYPYGFDFSRGYDATYAILGGALLNFIFNKVVSYNLIVLSILLLNGFFSYLFFQKITKSVSLGIIGGIIYGFSFYVLGRAAGHINLLLIGGFPLFFYTILSLREKQSLFNFILVVTSVVLIAFGSVQYLLFLLIFSFFFLIVSCLFYPNEIFKFINMISKNKRKLAVAIIYFIFIFLLFYYPYIKSLFIKRTFVFPNSQLQFFDLKPEIYDYILPNPFLKTLQITKLLKNSYQAKVDKVVFLGFAEIIAFLYFLNSKCNKRLKLYLLVMVAVFSGVPHLIYPYLYSYFPFSTTAEISRYYVFYYLILVIGIVLGLSSITNNKKRAIVFIAFFILIILERLPTNFYLSDIGEWKVIYDIVKQQNTEGIVILPLSNWYTKYNLVPVFTDKKLVEGYIHWSTNDEESNKFIKNCGEMNRFDLENEKIPTEFFLNEQFVQNEVKLNHKMLNCLKQNNIQIIVFDKYYRVYWDDFRHLLARTTLLFPHVSIVNTTVDVTKLEATRWAADKLNYSLYFPKKGVFRIYKIHYSNPSQKPIIRLIQNGNEVKIDDWQTYLNFEWNRWTRRITPPKNFFSISIDAGMIINFNSDEYTLKDGFLNIWYEFIEDKNSPIIQPPVEPLEKIYENEKVEVWKIN